jgi:hypothetical protein
MNKVQMYIELMVAWDQQPICFNDVDRLLDRAEELLEQMTPYELNQVRQWEMEPKSH